MAYGVKVAIDPQDFQEKCKLHAKNLAFISLREASEITKEYGHGYALATLRWERCRGGLRGKKLGRSVYVDWSMLLDFLLTKAG